MNEKEKKSDVRQAMESLECQSEEQEWGSFHGLQAAESRGGVNMLNALPWDPPFRHLCGPQGRCISILGT